MTTKAELYELIEQLDECQLAAAQEALTNILAGRPAQGVPVCDLGSAADIATLYETIAYGKKDKV